MSVADGSTSGEARALAYATGEMTAAEAEAFEAELAGERPEELRELRELRATAELLRASLEAEVSPGLGPERRAAVLRPDGRRLGVGRGGGAWPRRLAWTRPLAAAAAAMALAALGLWAWLGGGASEPADRRPQAHVTAPAARAADGGAAAEPRSRVGMLAMAAVAGGRDREDGPATAGPSLNPFDYDDAREVSAALLAGPFVLTEAGADAGVADDLPPGLPGASGAPALAARPAVLAWPARPPAELAVGRASFSFDVE